MTTSVPQGNEPVYSAAEREQQRFTHLVLGQSRPTQKIVRGKRSGRRKPVVREVPVALDPSIEREVQLRERWSHKRHATPQTLEYATSSERAGALARLYGTKTIDADQLAAAEAIGMAYLAIGRDVGVTTASFETRIDQGRNFSAVFYERLGDVWRELAYTRWRASVGPYATAILEIILDDAGLTKVARDWGIHNRRMRRILIDALDLWPNICSGVRRDVDESALIEAQAGMMG